MPLPARLAALRLAEGLAPTPATLERVARETDEEAARWAFGQWELRARAKGRFPEAARMLFVREALEQATNAELATYHATGFPAGERVVDLTFGVGGDGLALAARGPVLGFELDPERADYARWNLAVLGLTGEVREEDGLAWLRANGAPYVYADPARRVEGRRTLDPEDFSPDPFAVAEACRECRCWRMKLSPMMPDDALALLAPRVEFVSYGGECREALLVGGSESPDGGVWAVHPGREPLAGGTTTYPAAHPEGWLHDADPAAVRAHALGEFGLAALGDAPGYLVGARVDSPWLRTYRILDDVAPKRLKATLRSLGASAPVLKQRGARQDLDRWRRELGRHGDRPTAVAFYARGASIRALVLDPAESPGNFARTPR